MTFKIYTKSGDKGKTSLLGGKRVLKSELRIQCYGEADELNAHLAILHDYLHQNSELNSSIDKIQRIQNEIFSLCSELASTTSISGIPLVSLSSIKLLETEIDVMSEVLPELKNFIVPGGDLAHSYANLCRTVCRRVERSVVNLSTKENVRAELQQYLNRLSDWLFTLSRTILFSKGLEEKLWNPSNL